MRRFVFFLLTAPALAGPVEDSAEKALAAHRAGDAAALKALAGKDDPDPWLVADELCARGEHEAAEAFANAAPRPDVEGLPKYVMSRRGKANDASARATLAAANEALAAKDFVGALNAIDHSPLPNDDQIAAVRLAYGRGLALRALSRPSDSAGAFLIAARQARALRWLVRAARAFHDAAATAWSRSDFRLALSAWQELLEIDDLRGDPAGKAATLENIGIALMSVGSYSQALEYQERAVRLAADAVLAALRAGGDLRELAARDNPDPWLVADDLCARGEHDAAENFAKAAPRKDVERLPGYVASRRGKSNDVAARETLALAYRVWREGSAQGALDSLHRASAPEDTVVCGRLAIACALALRSLRRADDSAQAFLAAAATAERLGWLALAATALHEGGRDLHQRSDLPGAREAFERRMAIEDARGSHRVAHAICDVGLVHYGLKDYAKALSFLERALGLFEAQGDRPSEAGALGNIGLVYLDLKDYGKALTFYERALRIDEDCGNRAGTARALHNIGIAHECLYEHDRALRSYERALAIREELKDGRGTALTLEAIALVHDRTGSPAKALSFYRRSLALREEIGDRAGAGGALDGMGFACQMTGDHGEALRCFRRSLAIRRELGDEKGAANALANIANSHYQLGDFAEALSLMRQDLAFWERRGDRAEIARTLGNIGLVHMGRGEYAAALSVLERALALQQEIGQRSDIALTLGHLGSVHRTLGEHRKALALHERALETHEQLGNRLLAARDLVCIANVRHALGEHATALSLLERALTSMEGAGDRHGAGRTLSSIGANHHASGDRAKALAAYERALAIQEGIGDRAGAAATLSLMGLAYHDLGELDKSVDYLERARSLAARTGDRLSEADSNWRLAMSHLKRGYPEEAATRAREAVAILPFVVEKLPEEIGASWREQWAGLFEIGAEAGLRLDDPVQVSHFLESGRSMALLESLGGRRRLLGMILSDELCKADAEARACEREALARYRASLDEGGDTEALWRALEGAREQVIGAARRIQRESMLAGGIVYPEAAPLGRIQAALGEGEALVNLLLSSDTARDAIALVATRGSARIVPLGKSEAISKAVAAFHRAVQRPDERGVATPPHERLDFVARRLRALLVEPIKLDGVRRLLVAPDGELAYVPFALFAPEVEVAYVPSGTTYGVLLDDAALRGDAVFALGDPPAGDAQASAVYRGGEDLAPLPASRAEAQAIGDVVLVGKDATESGFAKAVASRPRWRAVHFACHGLVRADLPELSCLALGADAENDGFLTVLEVFRLKIPADLVVLSACETAKGKVYRAEGVIGLARAFMLAGSPRVICSLWKVDDAATRELMTTFYKEWKPGVGAAAALRKAQQHVASQEKWKDPYFWAAWQLWGLPE